MKFNTDTKRLDAGSWSRNAGIVGLLGLVALAVGAFLDRETFFEAYLNVYTFLTTLALGGLFFVLINQLTSAIWSVTTRRIAERLASLLPLMALFTIPLLFGLHDLYHWADHELMVHDEILTWKAPYLNPTFFVIRLVIYFSVWTLLVTFINRYSRRQDSGDPKATALLYRTSAMGIVPYAFTVTFFGFDLLMSLDAHWFSTIFGVYVFSGGFLGALAFLTLVILYLRRQGVPADLITQVHLADFGKMIFAFTVWWTYIGGAQYFLIWYANVPEETLWFLHRWDHGWKFVSLSLVLLHFIVPFFALVFAATKRTNWILGSVAALLVVMHFVDHYWLVAPSFHQEGVTISWQHFAALLGQGGIFLAVFARGLQQGPLLPLGDPKLQKSIHFSQ